MSSPSPVLLRNPRLETAAFDSSAAEPMTLCEVPAANGSARFAVPQALVELIDLFDGRRSLEDAVALYGDQHPGRYGADSLERLIHDFLLPKRLLLDASEPAEAVDADAGRRKSFLYLQVPLLDARVVRPVAAALAWAFRPWVILAWLPLFALLQVYFFSVLAPRHDLDFNLLRLESLLYLMFLSTLGTFLHEFGHASAASSFGCRRLEIGWGLYLIFPALYTDVSEAWRLPRRQRAVVDVGGVYFQSFFLAAMIGLYAATGHEIYLFAFLLSDLTLAASFNPFLRLDGYWLVSDLFGIPNLHQQTRRLLRHGGARLLGLRPAGEPPRLGRSAAAALVVYAVAGGGFFVYLLTVVLQRVVASLVLGFPEIVAEYWTALPGMTVLEALGGGVEIAWRGLMLVGLGFMLFNLLNRLTRLARAGLARLFPRPATAVLER